MSTTQDDLAQQQLAEDDGFDALYAATRGKRDTAAPAANPASAGGGSLLTFGDTPAALQAPKPVEHGDDLKPEDGWGVGNSLLGIAHTLAHPARTATTVALGAAGGVLNASEFGLDVVGAVGTGMGLDQGYTEGLQAGVAERKKMVALSRKLNNPDENLLEKGLGMTASAAPVISVAMMAPYLMPAAAGAGTGVALRFASKAAAVSAEANAFMSPHEGNMSNALEEWKGHPVLNEVGKLMAIRETDSKWVGRAKIALEAMGMVSTLHAGLAMLRNVHAQYQMGQGSKLASDLQPIGEPHPPVADDGFQGTPLDPTHGELLDGAPVDPALAPPGPKQPFTKGGAPLDPAYDPSVTGTPFNPALDRRTPRQLTPYEKGTPYDPTQAPQYDMWTPGAREGTVVNPDLLVHSPEVANGAQALGHMDAPVPHATLTAAQDLNYARAHLKDLEELVSSGPKGAATPEAAKAAAKAIKAQRDIVKNEMLPELRAQWEATKAHPDYAGMHPAKRLEVERLAEGGEPRADITPVPTVGTENPLPTGTIYLNKGGTFVKTDAVVRGPNGELPPAANVEYHGTTGGVPHYTVDFVYGEDSSAAILRLREAVRKAHPGATQVRISASPANESVSKSMGVPMGEQGSKVFKLRASKAMPELPENANPALVREAVVAHVADHSFTTMTVKDAERLIAQHERDFQLRIQRHNVEFDKAMLAHREAAHSEAVRQTTGVAREEALKAIADADAAVASMRNANNAEFDAAFNARAIVHEEATAQTVTAAKAIANGSPNPADEVAFLTAARNHQATSGRGGATIPEVPKKVSRTSGAVTVSPGAVDVAVTKGFGSRPRMQMAAKQIEMVKESPAAVSNVMERLHNSRPMRSINEWVANSVLFSEKVLSRNILSNFSNMLAQNLHSSIKTLVQRLPDGGSVAVREAAYEAALRSKAVIRSQTIMMKTATAAMRNDAGALLKAKSDPLWQSGQDVAEAWRTEQPQFMADAANGEMSAMMPPAIPGTIGKLIRLPRRAGVTADEFGKATAYHSELYTEAYLDGHYKGLVGDALDQHAEDFWKTAAPEVIEKVTLKAKAKALASTFNQPLGKAGTAVENVLNQVPGLRVLVPFFRIPVNVVKAGARQDPLGALASDLIRTDSGMKQLMRDGDFGRFLKSDAGSDLMARQAVGVSLWMGVGALAHRGLITGSRPHDKDEADRWALEGKTAYSIKIGGKWIPYWFLEPFAMTVGIAADVLNEHADVAEEDPESVSEFMSVAVVAYAKAFAARNMFEGTTRLLDFLHDPEGMGLKFASDVAASAVPSVLRTLPERLDLWGMFNTDRTIPDPKVYSPTGTLDQVATAWNHMKLSVGLRDGIPPKYSLFGPVERAPDLGWDFMSPFTSATPRTDPILKEVAKYDIGVDMGARLRTVTGGLVLTPQERGAFGKYTYTFKGEDGKGLLDILNAGVQTPEYQAMPEGDPKAGFPGPKETWIRDTISAFTAVAEQGFLAEHPELQARAVKHAQDKMAAKLGEPPSDDPTINALLEQ